MSALALRALAAANAAGVDVILDGDGLILDPMPEADLVAELKAVKPELLRVLSAREAARAILDTAEPPADCSEPRWVVARRALRRFIRDGWGDQATLLGWTLEELYAVPPVWPRVDLCGAALLIADRKVVAVTEATITTVGVTGSYLKFYRRSPAVSVIAQDVKAQVAAEVVAEVMAEVVADNAACMQINIQARSEITAPEPARPEPVRLEITGVPFYEFFCGSGMARAGLGAGWGCAFANDVSPMKIASYKRNWGGNSVRTADVARLTTKDLPGHAALAWASFPCPDLSEGGRGEGLQGARSNTLWPCLALLRALRAEGRAPRMIALENVTGLVERRGEAFFDLLCATLTDMGYRFGVLAIDAELFVPQSRPRIFVVAVDAAIAIPASLVAAGPAEPFHSPNLVKAVRRQKTPPIWFNLPAPPPRNVTLADIIEDAPTSVSWRSKGETDRLIAMMAPMHLAKLEAAQRASLSDGKRRVGSYAKRMRPDEGGRDVSGERIQRVEVRFDDVAGCLRTASGGGSSIQDIMVVDGDTVRTRRLSTREAARLMGLPDSYRLPSDYVAAYDLIGDGVAVPAVRWLAQHCLEPIVEAAAPDGPIVTKKRNEIRGWDGA